ncbi:hypothetical protein HMPREF9440_01402, partial [Sutterella parvirubra YIT 11816]
MNLGNRMCRRPSSPEPPGSPGPPCPFGQPLSPRARSPSPRRGGAPPPPTP